MVFGNKIDNPLAVSERELRYRMNLEKDTTDSNKIGVFMTSGIKGVGYIEGLRWLIVALKF